MDMPFKKVLKSDLPASEFLSVRFLPILPNPRVHTSHGRLPSEPNHGLTQFLWLARIWESQVLNLSERVLHSTTVLKNFTLRSESGVKPHDCRTNDSIIHFL